MDSGISQAEVIKNPSIYIVAGEPSGDRHGALLCRELLKRSPGARLLGTGGPWMRQAGQEQLFDLSKHAVVGLVDVLKKYGTFRKLFSVILKDIKTQQPDLLVLIDYPGFNLRLAKAVRQAMPKLLIVYYISPQVWAWKADRARKMMEWIDQLLVIFSFEVDWFREHAPELPVKWIGHPLMDRWLWPADRVNNKNISTLALMPGSRRREIELHLPVLLQAVEEIRIEFPNLRCMLLAPSERIAGWMQSICQKWLEFSGKGAPIELVIDYALTHLSRADLALVASGSATLECCVADTPMLVLYKTTPLTYWLGRKLVKIPYLSIVNILAQDKVVPEFLQNQATSQNLSSAAKVMLREHRWREAMQERLADVRELLGPSGASGRAAEAILELMHSKRQLSDNGSLSK